MIGSLPLFKKKFRTFVKARRSGSLGWFSFNLLFSRVWAESAPSCFRLEKAIANCKPTKIKTDPTTNFWTVYKKVADEHDDDLVSKYVGDLDTSLLFVSTIRLSHF